MVYFRSWMMFKLYTLDHSVYMLWLGFQGVEKAAICRSQCEQFWWSIDQVHLECCLQTPVGITFSTGWDLWMRLYNKSSCSCTFFNNVYSMHLSHNPIYIRMLTTVQHACKIWESTQDKNIAYAKELTILRMSHGSVLKDHNVHLEIRHFRVKENCHLLTNMHGFIYSWAKILCRNGVYNLWGKLLG